MDKELLQLYKELLRSYDVIQNFNVLDGNTDLLLKIPLLDFAISLTLDTFNKLMKIEFQDTESINNLLGSKKMLSNTFLDYLINNGKEVEYEKVNAMFRELCVTVIEALEYLLLSKTYGARPESKSHRMLEYYVLFYTLLVILQLEKKNKKLTKFRKYLEFKLKI